MTNNLPSKDINENIKFNLEKNMLQELQKPKIVTMIPKFMSSVPYNPFSMGPSNPMNGFATNGFQSQDQNVRESRQNIKLNPRLDIEDHSGYAHRRFSLNPLTSQGNNSEYLNKKPGMTENSGKHLRSSGQKHNENYSNRYE